MKALILVAENGGPTMSARIGVRHFAAALAMIALRFLLETRTSLRGAPRLAARRPIRALVPVP